MKNIFILLLALSFAFACSKTQPCSNYPATSELFPPTPKVDISYGGSELQFTYVQSTLSGDTLYISGGNSSNSFSASMQILTPLRDTTYIIGNGNGSFCLYDWTGNLIGSAGPSLVSLSIYIVAKNQINGYLSGNLNDAFSSVFLQAVSWDLNNIYVYEAQ
jgi:hypothetical protein